MTSAGILNPFEPKYFTIKSLSKIKFKFSDEYQRSGIIWDIPKKQKLIDSILHNYPVGTLVLIKRGKNRFEVVDGQQRLRIIKEFIKKDCKWKTSKDSLYPEESYRELKKEDSIGPDFEAYKIWYIPIPDSATDEQICDIFVRLQEGIPTNTAEKLNAMRGKIRNLVFKLKDLPFFRKTSVKEHRFNYREVLAYCALMELVFLNTDNFIEFPDLRYKTLKHMYEDYANDVPTFVGSKIRRSFNFMGSAFSGSAKFIQNNGDFLQVYLLASLLSTRYALKKRTKKIFSDFIKEFLSKTIKTEEEMEDMTEKEIQKNPVARYAVLRSKGQTKKNLKEKFTILILELFKKLKKIESISKKDKKRDFELCQKIFVYYVKDKEVCKKCRKKVKWEESSFHHKIFHSKGGRTTIENCQLMHNKCHIDFHRHKKDIAEVEI